jgi:NCAIR mutase (PurE)-related protein
MRRDRVRALLEAVASGEVSAASAVDHLAHEPVESLPFATIDHHRALRQGYPEVVLAEGKTTEQVTAIVERIADRGDGFLVTRANAEVRAALLARHPAATENVLGRTVQLASDQLRRLPGTLLVVTAGTGDLPVAEEAAVTASAMGATVERLTDVGVAGIHRLLAQHAGLSAATVVIVVAGMDGALSSVVGGLVRTPVIAVPTSVGYGASFHGLAALLTMLNCCAAGVTVVNIDNGFGAAAAAVRILGADASSSRAPEVANSQ